MIRTDLWDRSGQGTSERCQRGDSDGVSIRATKWDLALGTDCDNVHTSMPVCTSSLTRPCMHGGQEGGRVGRGIIHGHSKTSHDMMCWASQGRGWPGEG